MSAHGVGLTRGLGAYIFGDGPDAARYNCTMKSRQEWYQTGQQQIGLGIYFFLSGCCFESITLTALVTMHIKGLTRNPCYRIMFVLGFYEMYCIFAGSIAPGFFYLRGEVYCTMPVFSFILGGITVGLYGGTCWCLLLLALNRVAAMINLRSLQHTFDQNRSMNVLLLLSTVYSAFISLFSNPILFNSTIMSYLFDPMISEGMYDYSNDMHSYNNFITCVLLFIIYGILCVVTVFMGKKVENTTSKRFQHQVFVQAAVICALNAISEVLYVLIQIPAIAARLPWWAPVFAHIVWQWGMATSGILNCTINRTIRNAIIGYLKTGTCNGYYISKTAVTPVGVGLRVDGPPRSTNTSGGL